MNPTKRSEKSAGTGAKAFAKKLIASGALRFAGWWSIFAGALALYSVCPVCGTAGCPVGIGVTGVLAGLLAAIKQWGGRLLRAVAGMVRPSHRTRVNGCDEMVRHEHHHPPSGRHSPSDQPL